MYFVNDHAGRSFQDITVSVLEVLRILRLQGDGPLCVLYEYTPMLPAERGRAPHGTRTYTA
jgi:hypothetical protein